jgi:hypothetical protein
VVNGLMRDGREAAQPEPTGAAEREGREGLSGQGPGQGSGGRIRWVDGTPAAESRRGWIVRSRIRCAFEPRNPFGWTSALRRVCAQAGALAVPGPARCARIPFQGPACWSIAFHPVRHPSLASFDAVFSTESPGKKFADTAAYQGSIVHGVSCESPQQQMLGTRLPEANRGWKCRNAAAISSARWRRPLIVTACSWRKQTHSTSYGERGLRLTH